MAKGRRNYGVRLRPAETGLFPRLHAPEVQIVCSGRATYLWFGGREGGGCVGLLSGSAKLRKLAKEILARVGDK